MKTWILCVDQLGAKLYWRANAEDPVHFWTQIPYPSSDETYIEYIANVTRQACEAEERSSLIVCAEPVVLQAIRQHLTPSVHARIIGTVGCNLCHVSDARLNESSQGILEGAALSGFLPAFAGTV